MLEFLKQPGVYEAVLFMSGVFFYRLMIRIMSYTHMFHFLEKILVKGLLMLSTIAMSGALMFETKYSSMKEAGINEDDIVRTKRIDKLIFEQWANSAILDLKVFFPKEYEKLITFNDWDSAIDFLNEKLKKENKDNG